MNRQVASPRPIFVSQMPINHHPDKALLLTSGNLIGSESLERYLQAGYQIADVEFSCARNTKKEDPQLLIGSHSPAFGARKWTGVRGNRALSESSSWE